MSNNYQPEHNVQTNYPNMNTALTTGQWFGTLFVLCIPLINIIMTFVWAFSGSSNKGRSNFCKATLIWALIGIVICVVVTILFGSFIIPYFQEFAPFY